MNNRSFLYPFCYFFLFCIFFTNYEHNLHAQVIKRYLKYPKPSLVLVKLPTYHKRILVYEKAKNYKYAKICRNDAANVQKEMVADFKENFSFCDYYFFYDTLNDAILNKQFTGVLFDKNLNPVSVSPIAPDDTNYQIIYFGNYVSEIAEVTDSKKDRPGRENTYNVGSQTKRLVLLNHNFDRIPDPAPNGTLYTRLPTFFSGNKKGKKKSKPVYKSKKFDIYYYPSAKYLSSHMDRYYNEHKVE